MHIIRLGTGCTGRNIELNTNYRKGRRLEYKTMRVLERAGYETLRTAGSHGLFDVVAFSSVNVRCVQVKGNNYVSALEREKLELLRLPDNCTKEIWRWPDRAREPIIEVVN